MSTAVADIRRTLPAEWRIRVPEIAAALAFAALFWNPAATLADDWWNDPDAGHGLLLGPLAVYLAWKSGLVADRRASPRLGAAILTAAVALRYLSALAAEMFTMRISMLVAGVGLVVFAFGVRQLLSWWLPTLLLFLSVPLPDVLISSLAFPLQLRASALGASLLEWRHVPVLLTGNVIHLPGRTLFVTEACSGLRSLAALISLGLLIGGLWLRYPLSRTFLVLLSIPVAMLLNGIRIFLTGFTVFYIDPSLGEGFAHLTEGWVVFVVAFAILGGVAYLITQAEAAWGARR